MRLRGGTNECPICFDPSDDWVAYEERDGDLIEHHGLCTGCAYSCRDGEPPWFVLRAWVYVPVSVMRRVLRELRKLA